MGSGAGPTLAWNGHLDTVPVGSLDTWSVDPFAGEVVDGKLIGRGACDMKGPIAAALAAAAALGRAGVELRGTLTFHLAADEEHAGIHGTKVLWEQGLLTQDATIVGEPSELALGLAERGGAWVTATAYGKAAHGSQPHRGVNAITSMAGFLLRLPEVLPQIEHPLCGRPTVNAALIEGAGLRKGRDLWAWLSSTSAVAADKALRVGDRALKSNGVVVRPISMKNFWADVEKVWAVYNSAWARNWGFVPMTREEFLLSGKEMKQILDPELVLLGEVQGRVVGFALALPDINQALKRVRNGRLFPFGLVKILYYGRLITSVRVLALGVIEEYRTAGVAAAFYATLIRNARRLGYGDCEMSWILENNVLMNRSIEAMGGRRYKTYRMYEWD
jgi:GNAT superfamily N-acetyltransferase